MFWRFGGYANISTLDTILDKPDVTLEELLDESDLIQELKQHNTKLIEYLRDENVLRRLLEYVIAPQANLNEDEGNQAENGGAGVGAAHDAVENQKGAKLLEKDMSEEERDKLEKSRLKYTYVATEVLSSETWSILEALMENQQHLRDFWEFLRRPPPLENTIAGYFTKINETLLDKKTEEMLEFFRSLDNIVPNMLQHVDCPVVMDLLLKIISLEKAEGGQGIVDWLQSQNLIPTLLSYLSADHSPATQTSAGDFLKAIITISANASQNEQSCIGPNDMTRQLVADSCIESLISDMLRGGNPLTVGVGIIIEVIRKNNSDYDPDVGTGADSVPSSRDPIYLGTLLRMFAKHVPDFMELILSPNHRVSTGDGTKVIKREPLKAAFGEKIEPLGFDRFKTCELMAELLHCSNMGLLNERGSELYVKERDQERERLKAEGALTQAPEGQSGADYTEDSAGFHRANSPSALGSGSPEEIRRLEVANSGDDDGFEDVGASGVLNEEIKDDFDEESASERRSRQSGEDASLKQGKPRLDLGDEFVDEPLSSPRLDAQHPEKVLEDGVPSAQSTAATTSEPLSPTSSGLTEKVGDLDLDNDTIMTSPPSSDFTYEEEQHETQADQDVPSEQSARGEHKLAPPLPQRDQPVDSKLTSATGDLSPHPDDKPAPLFAARSEPTPHQDESTSKQGESEIGAGNSQETIDTTLGEEGDSVRSILLSGNEQDFEPHIETDIDGQPVVGDFLKMMFVEHRVVPTILDFFFRFPWNNFLHNVVYDVVQQVFNGPMDRGYNRSLAIDLFETGRITEHIVEGQKRSDEAQERNRMRLGYMGHLTLVAEEVVKFSERNPSQLLPQSVLDKVMHKQWIDYVEHTLSETRERDNAILGGVRPDMSLGPRQAVINAVNAVQGFGNGGSSALANAGLNGGGAQGLDSIDLANSGSASSGAFGLGGGSLLSGFGSSSDEEDEEMEEGEEHEGAARGGSDQDFSTYISSSLSALDNFGSTSSSNPSSTPDGPPPPPPLNIPPSRARRQLAARLALQKQKQAQQPAGAQEFTSRTTAGDFSTIAGDADLGSSPPTLYAEPTESSQEIQLGLISAASPPSTSLSIPALPSSTHQQQQNRTSTTSAPAIPFTTSPTLFTPAANSSPSSSSSASSSSDSDSNEDNDHDNGSASQSNNNNNSTTTTNDNQTTATPNSTTKNKKPHHHHHRRRRRRPSTTEATTRSALEPDSSSSSSSSSSENNNNSNNEEGEGEGEGEMIDVALHRTPRAESGDSHDARPEIDAEMVDDDDDEDDEEDEDEGVVEMRGMKRGDLLGATRGSGGNGGAAKGVGR